MARKLTFSTAHWIKINETLRTKLAEDREPFGIPEHRTKSVVLGTFNIRELSRVKNRSKQAWNFLKLICQQFDLLAIQEVQDDLSGIRELKHRLGDSFGLVVSDTTGKTPGRRGNAERLAFLFRWARIRRTELASDISFDRTTVAKTLFDNRLDFSAAFDEHQAKLNQLKIENKLRKTQGKRKKPVPAMVLPMFLTFIRQPHCTSFEVMPAENSSVAPFEFLVVNAHLLYGQEKHERRWEFEALIEWLALRAKSPERTYYDNILMMGDCNLEFENSDETREELDEWLKTLNSTKLKSKKAAKVNFPLLDPHPNSERNPLRTNARQDQTYDQIAIFAHDKRLPDYKQNEIAGATPDGYDYGIFKFTDLFASALFDTHGSEESGNTPFEVLSKADQKWIIARTEWDVSDHMPAWFRLPIPGA